MGVGAARGGDTRRNVWGNYCDAFLVSSESIHLNIRLSWRCRSSRDEGRSPWSLRFAARFSVGLCLRLILHSINHISLSGRHSWSDIITRSVMYPMITSHTHTHSESMVIFRWQCFAFVSFVDSFVHFSLKSFRISNNHLARSLLTRNA